MIVVRGRLERTTARRKRSAPDGPAAEVAEERHEERSAHVEGRQGCGDDADPPQRPCSPGWRLPENILLAEKLHGGVRDSIEERVRKDLVLREEPARERNADDGERRSQERPEGERHRLSEAAHVAHVL